MNLRDPGKEAYSACRSVARAWPLVAESIDHAAQRSAAERRDKRADEKLRAAISGRSVTLGEAGRVLRGRGFTDADIGEMFGVSSVRVREILGDGFE